MIGAVLVYGPVGTSATPHDHPWPGGERRAIEPADVFAKGKHRPLGDAVAR